MMKRLFLSITLVASGLPVSAQARRAYVPNFLPPGMAQRPPPLTLPLLGSGAGIGNLPSTGGAPISFPMPGPGQLGGGFPGLRYPMMGGGFGRPSLLSSLGSFLIPLFAQLFGGGRMGFGGGFGQPAIASPGMYSPTAAPAFAPTASANDSGLCINCDRTASVTKPVATASTSRAPVSSPAPMSDLTSTEAKTTETCVDCDKGPQQTPSVGQLATVASAASCPSSDTDICNMFAGVNDMRREANMPALDYDPTCQAAADVHGRDMASQGFFDHKGSDGSQVDSRYRRVSQGTRVSALGENIFMVTEATSSAAAQANKTFKESEGHYKNIISPYFTHVGLARVQGRCQTGGTCTYYVQCFSHPVQ